MNIYQLGSMLLSAHMFIPTTSIERNSFLSKNILVYTMQKHKNDNNYDPAKHSFNFISSLGIFNDFVQSVLKPNKDFYEQIYYDRFARGIICGHIVLTCISKKKSISSSIDEYLNDIDMNEHNILYPYRGIMVKHTKTNIINNIWPIYKKVAVYWCTLIQSKVPQNIHSKSFIDFTKFESDNPKIKATGFEGFCKLTDAYIQLATDFIPPRSSKPLLESHEALPVLTAIEQLLLRRI